MSHPHHDIFENRRQFQLERMILFSDAVFAIAITLLVIEIKVPEVAETGVLSPEKLREYIFHLLPQLGGFIMSFFIVGMFWTTHHRVFSHVVDYDGKLMWLNLMLLLTVSFLPFTTSLVSQHGYLNLAYGLYSFNLGMIGLMSFFIWVHISNPAKNLSVGLEDIKARKYGRVRSFVICCIFFSGAVLCCFDNPVTSWISRFVFFLIFPAISIIKKRYGVKIPARH